MALQALGMHETQRTLVSELQPTGGNFSALVLVGGLLVLRQLAGLRAIPMEPFAGLLAFRFGLGHGLPDRPFF